MNIQKISKQIVWDKKPQHTRNSVCLSEAGILHRVEQGNGAITHRQTKKPDLWYTGESGRQL